MNMIIAAISREYYFIFIYGSRNINVDEYVFQLELEKETTKIEEVQCSSNIYYGYEHNYCCNID